LDLSLSGSQDTIYVDLLNNTGSMVSTKQLSEFKKVWLPENGKDPGDILEVLRDIVQVFETG